MGFEEHSKSFEYILEEYGKWKKLKQGEVEKDDKEK